MRALWGHDGGILDYQTLVSASEKGERIAVVSLRGPPGHLFVERALLCTEPPPVAGSAQASWKISFSSGPGPLYVMNADGSGQRWLTLTLSSWGTSPWSPDGRRIAFGSGRDGNGDVYAMNADGSAQRNLTRNPSHDFAPSWSPDGRRIAFLSSRGGNSEIYAMNTDGSRQRNLTRNPANDSAFAWSPDSRRIAFTSKRDGNWEVYVMTADGSGQRRLTRSPRYEGGPAWSPDGRKLAFVGGSRSCRAGAACAGNTDVYVMNADGSGQRRLTRAPRDDFVPAWSPDGRKIAFVSKRDGNAEIYVMNTDGSEQRKLTRSPTDDGLVAWSPVRTK